MKAVFTILFIACFLHGKCQSIDEAVKLYANHSYAEALDMCRKMADNPVTAAFANDLAGRIYVDQGNYAAAIPYLKKAIQLDNNHSYISGWCFAYLGQAHIMTGEKEKGISELNNAIALHKTGNSIRYAQDILDRMQPGPAAMDNAKAGPKWITINGLHIIYRFQDTVGWGSRVKQYIDQHETAYIKINETFHATLTQKITFYIWNDPEMAKKVLGKELGFSIPWEFKCNVDYRQTIGHELTHVLSYWGWGTTSSPQNMTRLINEGVAVAFDQTARDKYETAKKAMGGEDIHSITDVWKEQGPKYQKVLYPLGGAFVTYLYKKSSPEQFKSIIKDQTIENAEKTYGIVQFGMMVTEFNNMMGLN